MISRSRLLLPTSVVVILATWCTVHGQHERVEITLNTYAHVLPDMQQQAAATIGVLLHG